MSASESLTPTPASAPDDGSASGEPLLQARAVTRRFGGLVAVRDVDLDIPKGGIVSIIGPNGAGKTTFFNVVAGIIDPTAGTVRFRGRTLISRPHRTWLEPVAWVLPAILVLLVALALGVPERGESAVAIAGSAVVGILAATLLLAIVRPVWYTRLMDRFGVLRSARPNDVVAAGIGRTFQNIRLFQNMSALENVLVGMHLKLHSNLVTT
jgi:branched-chain amino acid transport system ATP-binding protein